MNEWFQFVSSCCKIASQQLVGFVLFIWFNETTTWKTCCSPKSLCLFGKTVDWHSEKPRCWLSASFTSDFREVYPPRWLLTLTNSRLWSLVKVQEPAEAWGLLDYSCSLSVCLRRIEWSKPPEFISLKVKTEKLTSTDITVSVPSVCVEGLNREVCLLPQLSVVTIP